MDCWDTISDYRKDKIDQLIYTPNNTIFKNLIENVSDQLNLTAPIGVSDDDQLQDILVNQTLSAGISFHHSNVS